MIILVDVQRLRVSILSKKRFLAAPNCFNKINSFTADTAHLRHLDSPWWSNCNNSWQELNQSNFYSSEPEKISSLNLFTTDSHVKIILILLIHNIPHTYCRNTLPKKICHRVDICKFVKRLVSSFR